MLKVIELFAGIGSQHSALEKLGIDYQIVGISEIDKFAIKSYESIHGEVNNFGDISQIEKLPDSDFWTYSFPCQDLSKAGNLKGLAKNTRSGLLYEVERLLIQAQKNNTLPKYLMLENVKNLISLRFKSDFVSWLHKLDALGYNSYYKVLNAKDYDIPQNRERIFVVSIRKDIDKGYVFPESIERTRNLEDLLEKNVDEKYFLSKEKTDKFIPYFIEKGQEISYCLDSNYSKGIMVKDYLEYGKRQLVYQKIKIPQAVKNEFIECDIPGVFDYSYPNSMTRRGRVQESGRIVPTLTTTQQDIYYVNEEYRIRKLLPIECFRLMGFTDDQFKKAQSVCSDHQLYRQAGNSIVVDVLYYIFKNLFIGPGNIDIQLRFDF